MTTVTASEPAPPVDLPACSVEPGSRLRPTLLALHWWHAWLGAAVAFTAVWTLLDGRLDAGKVAAVALYAVLCVWYVVAPDGFWRQGGGRVYLAGALAIFAAAVACTPDASFLLFALIPQTFVVLEARPAWVVVVGLSLLSSASQLALSGRSQGNVISIGIFGVMTIVLSLLVTGWVSRIAEQSQQRAELIEELDRTRAELARVSRDAGTAAERARLAGEIHDTLAQGFISILMLLQAAQAGLGDESAPSLVRRQLSLAEASAREGLAEARSLVDALAPVALQTVSLPDAVRRVVDDVGQRSGVRARFEVVGAPRPLAPDTEVVLLRGAQEALANVHRHADAAEVTVSLAYDATGSRLTVIDDGRGFDPGRADGYGLRGMRARVEQAGGRLTVRSSPGEGSTVELCLP